MKKIVLLAALALTLHSFGFGQILYEDFNYTVPGNIGGNGNAGSSSNGWTTHSVTNLQTTTIDVLSGNLSYTGLANSNGNRVYMFGNANAMSRDVNRAITTTATTLYYSSLIKILDNSQITATGDYFIHFGATAGTSVTSFGGRLGAKSVNSGANFRFMIQNTSTGTITFTELAQDLDFNTTYLVVVKYDRSASPTVASLWVNPTSLGGSEPTGQVTNNSGTASFAAFASICLRNNATTPKAEIDEIRVGTTWADVTPPGGSSAPTLQTSNFTFSSIIQTQMNVSWTNGNGAKRIVKINTTNSFTDPTNGSDPTANSVYSGSGQQVVFNGSASTIPTVTGLTANTTYWFKAWEYNGSAGSTLYCTATGANNPLSQATAAAATAPLVSSPTATSIEATSAVLGGTVTADGGATVTARGTVWSTVSPVTEWDHPVAEGSGTGVFSHLRTGLPFNTPIYYAAYATNSQGTTLSAQATFTTPLPEPSNHVLVFTANSPNYSSIVNNWQNNNGTQPATGFLLLISTTNSFTAPVDKIPVPTDYDLSDGKGATNVSPVDPTFTWLNLNSLTPYYFAIYPYTNSGSFIDYKTDPIVPTTSATTQAWVAPLAAWTFDVLAVQPNTPTSVLANVGTQTGTAALYTDGTNGSLLWDQATELNSFGGSTVNDPRQSGDILAGSAYSLLGGTGNSANGKSMVIKFSMVALQNPILTFATRGTSTGFSNHQWAWSTDGTNFIDFGTNTAVITTSFILKTLDMSDINALDGATFVYLRVTFSGASTETGNNRLDNIVIRASSASGLAPTVTTVAADPVTANSATLKGTVNANSQDATVYFEYGTSPGNYGAPVAAVPPTVTGNSPTNVTFGLGGLAQNTPYYFRVTATNASGPSYGSELTFTTGCLPAGNAGAISGPTTVYSDGTTQYHYTVPTIANATNYVWSFPLPALIVAGEGTNSVYVVFYSGAASGNASVYGENACLEPGESSQFAISVYNVPGSRTVNGTVNAGEAVCYDATQTITVAGNSTTYEIFPLGSASMKAGVNIRYLAGTWVHSGGFMVGKIYPNGPFCSGGDMPSMLSGLKENSISLIDNSFRIYPNPTTGNFTVEQLGEVQGRVTVDVIGSIGGKVMSAMMQDTRKQEFSISGNPTGIYFVKLTTGDKVQTVKIILTK